jgi:hypothetical protein
MTTDKSVELLNSKWAAWLDRAASVRLTLVCVVLAMFLVLVGTLAQVHMGTFAAQKVYFNSWFLYWDLGDWKVPYFPGGLSVGALWMANLVASFISRFRLKLEDLGIYVTHLGIIFLLLGQFLTQTLGRETQMPLEVGQSGNYSISQLKSELAVIKTSNPDYDEVTSIPESSFSHEGEIHPPHLPFYLVIRRFMRNAQLGMAQPGSQSIANMGIGPQIAAEEIPPVSSDNETNNVTAYVEVRDGTKSRGVWLISSGLGAPQSFNVQGNDYQMFIRPKRTYFPFTLTLKEFHHDIYPGTDIPKNFSSLVNLSNPENNDSRTALIYMNHPLRYEGRTFYQASFGEGDKLSVFQVMENPASLTPYMSCAIVAAGLLIQFLSHLFAFIRRRHETLQIPCEHRHRF